MIFQLVPAFGVILLASHVCCPWYGVNRQLPASETVTREGLNALKIGTFRELTWDDYAKAILGQKGSLIARDDNIKKDLDHSFVVRTHEVVVRSVLDDIGWTTEKVEPGLYLWDSVVQRDQQNGINQYSKIEECKYPYSIPRGAKHYIDWIRVGFLDNDSFTSIGITMSNNPERVQALKEYIDHFDFYGHYGLPPHLANLPNDQKSLFAHPTPGDVWYSQKVPGQIVTRDEGIAAIDAAAKRINEHLKVRFPEEENEMVWNRSPTRYKSITGPDHFHVFVYPKALRLV